MEKQSLSPNDLSLLSLEILNPKKEMIAEEKRSSNPNPDQKKLNLKEILQTIFYANSKNEEKNRIMGRIQQPRWVYFFTLFFTLLTGFENLYIFLWESFEQKDIFIFLPSLIIRLIFFVGNSYYLSRNWKILLKLFSSFDRILVAEIAMMISVGVFTTKYIPYSPYPWFYYSLYALYPMLILTFSCYFRTMMIYCKWKPWQTILIKIAVASGAGAYFGLGMYYTVADGKFTDGASEELDGIILNILILFAFAGFDYHLQIFSIIDETDGTNSYNLTYELNSNPEDIEFLIGINNNIRRQRENNTK